VMPVAAQQLAMLPKPHFFVNGASYIKLVVYKIDDFVDYLCHTTLRYKVIVMYQRYTVKSTGNKKAPFRGLQTLVSA
jgi:hypothetical protein